MNSLLSLRSLLIFLSIILFSICSRVYGGHWFSEEIPFLPHGNFPCFSSTDTSRATNVSIGGVYTDFFHYRLRRDAKSYRNVIAESYDGFGRWASRSPSGGHEVAVEYNRFDGTWFHRSNDHDISSTHQIGSFNYRHWFRTRGFIFGLGLGKINFPHYTHRFDYFNNPLELFTDDMSVKYDLFVQKEWGSSSISLYHGKCADGLVSNRFTTISNQHFRNFPLLHSRFITQVQLRQNSRPLSFTIKTGLQMYSSGKMDKSIKNSMPLVLEGAIKHVAIDWQFRDYFIGELYLNSGQGIGEGYFDEFRFFGADTLSLVKFAAETGIRINAITLGVFGDMLQGRCPYATFKTAPFTSWHFVIPTDQVVFFDAVVRYNEIGVFADGVWDIGDQHRFQIELPWSYMVMQSSVKRKERKRAVFIPYYSEKKTYAMAFSELLIRPSLQYRFKWKTLAITPSLKQCIPFFLLYGSGKKGSESSSSKSAYKRAYRGGTQFGCTVNWSIRPR